MKKIFNRIIIASNNSHKVDEIKEILKDFPYEVVSLKEAGIDVEVEENGKTFIENARIKATAIVNLTGEAALADDSGLEVYALNGEPGVYSARYSGEHGNYKKNNLKLLDNMKDIPKDKRGARFTCAMVFLTPENVEIIAEGHVEGVIGFEEKGSNGFGYDPLFIVPELNKTFAELTSEEKNAISHRGRALADLKKKLTDIL